MIVIVEVAPVVVAVTGFGKNDTLVFAGFPVALNVTTLPEPIPVTEMTAVPEVPRRTVSDVGEAEIVKSAVGAFTVTVTVVECEPLVPVPVMVTV